jgi:hypothetical protein
MPPEHDDPAHAVPPNTLLADALETQDSAAVAFALRNHGAVMPLLPGPPPAQIRVFRADGADRSTVLVFSSAEAYARVLPGEKGLVVTTYSSHELADFLESHGAAIETVWFDVAGPHPMRADPVEVLAALRIDGPSGG